MVAGLLPVLWSRSRHGSELVFRNGEGVRDRGTEGGGGASDFLLGVEV